MNEIGDLFFRGWGAQGFPTPEVDFLSLAFSIIAKVSEQFFCFPFLKD
jgi:hypothetical protein